MLVFVLSARSKNIGGHRRRPVHSGIRYDRSFGDDSGTCPLTLIQNIASELICARKFVVRSLQWL